MPKIGSKSDRRKARNSRRKKDRRGKIQSPEDLKVGREYEMHTMPASIQRIWIISVDLVEKTFEYEIKGSFGIREKFSTYMLNYGLCTNSWGWKHEHNCLKTV